MLRFFCVTLACISLNSRAETLSNEKLNEEASRIGNAYKAGTQWKFSAKAIRNINSGLSRFDPALGQVTGGFYVGEQAEKNGCSVHGTVDLAKAKGQIAPDDVWTFSEPGPWIHATVPKGYHLRKYTLTNQKGQKLDVECDLFVGVKPMKPDPDVYDVTPKAGPDQPAGAHK